MQKIILSGLLAGASLCTLAQAQSSVTVYGVVDTGVARDSNADAAGGTRLWMPSLTGSQPSRLGFKGSEDLGGGLKAQFVLETGLLVDAGGLGQGNRFAGRQAYVGLGNSYGTLMLGRQMTMTAYSLFSADVMGPSIHGLGSIDPYIPNARSDNTVGYLGKFSGVTLGATYSLGRDSAATGGPAATNCPGELASDKRACRQWSVLMKFEAGSSGIAAAVDKLNGGPGALLGLNNSNFTDARVSLNGWTMASKAKIGIGWIGRTTRTALERQSDLFYVGASLPLTDTIVLDTQLARFNVKNSADDATLLVMRGTYNLSSRTALYGSLGYVINQGGAAIAVSSGGTVGIGLNQLGMMTGIRHTF